MKISADEVRKVAGLARLRFSGEEIPQLAAELDRILTYVDKLSELDTDGVEPTTHAVPRVNAFREDEVTESLPREEALANAPADNGESFVVPRVI